MAKSNSFRIETVDKAVFKDCAQIELTTTMEMSNAVNAFFSVYADFVGSYLAVVKPQPNMPSIVSPILRFKVFPSNSHNYATKRTPELNGDGTPVKDANGVPIVDVEYPLDEKGNPIYTAFAPYDAIDKTNNAGKRSVSAEIEKIRRISSSGSANPQTQVYYTSEGKSGLEPFMRKNSNRTVDWDRDFDVKVLYSDTIISVYNIDINALLGEIYGNRDENGGRIWYNVSPINPLATQMMNGAGENWSVQILRTLDSNLIDSAQKLGVVPTNYGVPMTPVARTA